MTKYKKCRLLAFHVVFFLQIPIPNEKMSKYLASNIPEIDRYAMHVEKNKNEFISNDSFV